MPDKILRPKTKLTKLIPMVAVAMLIGVVAVYFMKGSDGNLNDNQIAKIDKNMCVGTLGRAQSLKKLMRGEVAAMTAREDLINLNELTFFDPGGKATNLDIAKGKIKLLNLWATWCAPCRAEMPALDALQTELGSEKFEVMAVNIDSGSEAGEKPTAFFKEMNIKSLKLYSDSTLEIFDQLKQKALAFGLPVTLLIDENNCVLGSMNGPAEWASDDAKNLIRATLK